MVPHPIPRQSGRYTFPSPWLIHVSHQISESLHALIGAYSTKTFVRLNVGGNGGRNQHCHSQRSQGLRLSAAEVARHRRGGPPRSRFSRSATARKMSQHQGGPTGYSTHSPITPEYESPTSQTHRHPIGMGAGRHDRTRVRNASEGADSPVDERWRIESTPNAGDAYSQSGRHRLHANYDYGAPFPSSHVTPNNTGA